MNRVSHAPARHLERYSEVARVLVDEGFEWLVDQAGLSKLTPKRVRARRAADDITPEQHVRHALERLGVTFIKGGQALSTRIDIVPQSLAAELAKLQDEVTSEPFETMREVIEYELEAPIQELFGTFDENPIGAASVGQVYCATLPDGSPVAVKVQKPGVADQADVDIEIALTFARRAQGRLTELGDLDLVGLTAEFADALRGEFDYLQEGKNAERLRRTFKDDDTVVVPRIHWSHTTSRVLTMELLDGVSMNHPEQLDSAGCDRSVLALRGINAYLHMIFDVGFFQADPHPGNFLALAGNRVGFTDFGRVGSLSMESRQCFIDLLGGIVDRDPEAATDALLSLASRPDVDELALQRDVARLIGKYVGRELGRISTTDLFGDALRLFRRHELGIPNDFAVMLATLAVLEGVGTMLDPTFDFASAVTPFVERALRERLAPTDLAERFGRDARRGVRMLERLPSLVDRILRRASRGEFRLEIVPREYQSLLDQVTELVNRLAFAVVVAALIIGATTLLSATSVPPWLSAAGEMGLGAALLVSVWLFGSIIASHVRSRRRR